MTPYSLDQLANKKHLLRDGFTACGLIPEGPATVLIQVLSPFDTNLLLVDCPMCLQEFIKDAGQ